MIMIYCVLYELEKSWNNQNWLRSRIAVFDNLLVAKEIAELLHHKYTDRKYQIKIK